MNQVPSTIAVGAAETSLYHDNRANSKHSGKNAFGVVDTAWHLRCFARHEKRKSRKTDPCRRGVRTASLYRRRITAHCRGLEELSQGHRVMLTTMSAYRERPEKKAAKGKRLVPDTR